MAKDEVNVKKAKKEKKEHHKKKEKEKKKKEHHKKKEECSDSDDNNKIVPTLDITPYPFKYVAKNKADEIINEYFTRFQIQIIKCKFVKYIVKLYYLNNNTLLKEFVFIVERTNSNTEKNSKRLFNGDKSGYPGKDGNTYNREVTKAIINFITDTVVASVTVETTTPDAVGQSYTVDGITYTIISLSTSDVSNGTVYIQTAVNNGSSIVTIPNTVQFQSDNLYNVISIGVPPNVQVPSSGNGFQGQTWLESININTYLAYISPSAFYGCFNLLTVNFSSGSLLQSIGNSAFQGTKLFDVNNLNLCTNLTFIGQYAFYDLYLESILLPSPGAGLIIDNYAFYSNEEVTSINLGTNLVSIGTSSFYGCTGLGSVTFPTSLILVGPNSFQNCSNLQTVTFPNSGSLLTTIGNSAFQGTKLYYQINNLSLCTNLTYIGQYAFYGIYLRILTLPNSPAGLTIDDFAFANNYTLGNVNGSGTIYLGNNVVSIGNNAFQNVGQTYNWLESISIPATVTSIGASAFYGCYHLTDVIFSTQSLTLTSIGNSAFQGTILTYANLNDCLGLTYIGQYAFYGVLLRVLNLPTPPVTGLTVDDYAFANNYTMGNVNGSGTIYLGNNVVSIGNNAFENVGVTYNWLEYINIPATVTLIGASAFYGCYHLTNVIFPSSGSLLTNIENSAFQGTSLTYANLNDCLSLTYIGSYAFYDLYLKSIFLPSPEAGLTVDEFAFYYNDYAGSINLGTNLVSINNNVFQLCSGVPSIIIPTSVQTIEASAFEQCSKLETVTFSSSGSLITSIGNSAFQGTSLYYATNLENCSKLTYIGQYAFYDLYLQTILLPSPLTGLTVDNYAFTNNDYATEVQLGSAQTINTEVFYGCSKASAVYFQSNLSSFNLENLFNNSSLYQVYVDIVGNVVGNITTNNTLIVGSSSYISQIILTSNVTSIYSECQICNPSTQNVSYIQFNSNIFASDTLGNYVGPLNVINTFFYIPDGIYSPNLSQINFNVATIGGYQINSNLNPVIFNIPESTNPNLILSFNNTTNVQPSAFYGCANINSVSIPSSVTSVGNNAFSECINLITLVIDTYISNFQSVFQTISNVTGNASIQSITFNYSNNIPDNSCQNFSALETLFLDNVTSIGTTAFYDCVALTSVSIPLTVTSIGDNAFSQCISLKTLVIDTYISNFASVFQTTLNITGNTSIQSITFLGYSTPSGVSESIPENACQNFSALETLVLYNGLIGIGSYAFNGCALLTYADIPSSVLSDNFGTFVFAGCSSLTQVILPNSSTFTNIPDYTFSDCSKLSSINASTLTYITSYGQNTFSNCGFTGFTIPDSVTSIGISVFEGSDNLSSITLSTDITSIPSSAFYGCLNLANVENLSPQVTYIGQYAFSNSGIDYISIPGSPNSSLSGIDEYAFSGCSNLTVINVPYLLGINSSGTFIPTILEGVFSGCGLRNIDFTNTVSTTTNSVFTPEISTINANAFFKCVDLTSINLCNFTDTNVLTNYVSDLGVAAFGNCEQLNTVTLFSGINGTTSLININNGNNSFSGCTSLQNSSFPGIIITDYGVDEPPAPNSEDEVAYYFTTNGFNNTIYLPVIYNGNGNTGGTAPLSANYQQGFTVTVSGNTGNLVNTGFTFNGWTTLPSGGTYYAPNDTFTIGIYTVLYADWV